jgi:hypothetical protein
MEAKKDEDVLQQIAALRKLTVAGLRGEYLKLFGEESNSRNKTYLFKRLAYRIQEKKYGGLSQRAKDRAKELAKDAPIRRRLLGNGPELDIKRDPRLPKPGSLVKRDFKGKSHEVKVLKDGFEFKGKQYGSLSAIAKLITGTSWNGFTFFGCGAKG